ncbi:MAG: 1-phosphofructokinase family hexose kinase [Saccharofermentanales bacterium]
MRSIIVVCLSPAIDRNYKLPLLTPGAMHRCENPILSPGGKGVNVARVLSLLGAQAHCIGFFAGENGKYIISDLQQHNVIVDSIMLKGETRSSLNILDQSTGKETEILEAGPTVYPNDMERFLIRFHQILFQETKPPIVIFSGGVPRGLPTSVYEELIGIAKTYNAECLLDSSSEALSYGVKAQPYLIKPNMRELSFITNKIFNINTIIDKNLMTEIYYETRRFGIPLVAVTLGNEGAMLCLDGKVIYVHPLAIQAVNTIGSGDSFTAGIAFARANQYAWKQMLELATACAASNALFEQVGFIDLQQVKDFQNKVVTDEIIIEMS